MEIKNISTRISNTRIRFKEANIKVIFGSKILIEESEPEKEKDRTLFGLPDILEPWAVIKSSKSDYSSDYRSFHL